jgi:hypothetical protein
MQRAGVEKLLVSVLLARLELPEVLRVFLSHILQVWLSFLAMASRCLLRMRSKSSYMLQEEVQLGSASWLGDEMMSALSSEDMQGLTGALLIMPYLPRHAAPAPSTSRPCLRIELTWDVESVLKSLTMTMIRIWTT